MLFYNKLIRKPRVFKRLTGVSVNQFEFMAHKLEPFWSERRNNFDKGGRKHKLEGVKPHLLAMLIYYRTYITYEFLGFLFGVDETTVLRAVRRIEQIAIKVLHIKKDKQISQEETEALIIDATEQQIQRPKKGQRDYYSGKKKKHTLKTQIVVSKKGRIKDISKAYKGKRHDYNIYKKKPIKDNIDKFFDSGYQGVQDNDSRAKIPKKKPKGGELTDEEKKANRKLSKVRIIVENVIGDIKTFRIFSETYRNRRKNYSLRMNIVAGIVNLKFDWNQI